MSGLRLQQRNLGYGPFLALRSGHRNQLKCVTKNQRVRWKNNGAEKQMESMRSRIPPWPSIVLPKSFTPRSRLMADMVSPPANPMSASASDMPRATSGGNGVIDHNAVPRATAVATPPMKPSQVLLGEMAGAIFLF